MSGPLGPYSGLEASAADLAAVDTVVDAILVDTSTTLDAALAVVDGVADAVLVDTAALDIVKLQFTSKNTTAAANATSTTLLTVGTAAIWVEYVCLVSNGATTADLTTAAIEVGDGLHVLIDTTSAAQAALDATGKRATASAPGAGKGVPVYLAVGDTLSIDLVGTGATAVDLTLFVGWRATATGATLT